MLNSLMVEALTNLTAMFISNAKLMLSLYLILLNLNEINNGIASAKCRPAEYQLEDRCCPTCPAGMHVKRHCTEYRSTSCASCTGGTFQEGQNGHEQCFVCKHCDPGLGLKEKRSCSSTSDALCEPLDGFFCSNSNGGGCRAAQRHRVCSPGQHIGQRGTADNDTECLHCTDGTFSDGTSSSCQNHTKCESVGRKRMKPGTDSTDSECGEHGAHKGQVAGGVIAGVILALIIIAIILRKKLQNGGHILRNQSCTTSTTSSSHSMNSTTSPSDKSPPEATLLISSDSPAPTGDQQQPTTTTPAATMDGHDGDQSLGPGPVPPSRPTRNGSVSVTAHPPQSGSPLPVQPLSQPV